MATSSVLVQTANAIADYEAPPGQPGADSDRRDLSSWFLLIALLGFLVESLWVGRRRVAPAFPFEIGQLGQGIVLAALGLSIALAACGDSPLEQAHRANEEGIAADSARVFGVARQHFERSIGFGLQPEIPTYNLGRSLIRAGSHSEAREALQRALELDPELVDAYFNDGHALYELGAQERDPRDCDLERTRDLWRAARERFQLTVDRAGERGDLATAGRANREAMDRELESLEALIASPPPECLAASPEDPMGGGGSEDEPDASSGGGGAPAPEARGGGQGTGPLEPEERQTIAQALERIARQGRGEGRFHRRTVPEQFPRTAWSSPDPELWW